ncbi:MAG: hypothetical protein Kow0054_19010 [Deferrisoma sp.]
MCAPPRSMATAVSSTSIAMKLGSAWARRETGEAHRAWDVSVMGALPPVHEEVTDSAIGPLPDAERPPGVLQRQLSPPRALRALLALRAFQLSSRLAA